MTKRDLVTEVAQKVGLTQNETSDIVQAMLDTITGFLVEGERLEVRNFGVFEVHGRDPRIGRNPRTGEEVPIPSKRVAAFKPGKALKELVQNPSGEVRRVDSARPESPETPPPADESGAGPRF